MKNNLSASHGEVQKRMVPSIKVGYKGHEDNPPPSPHAINEYDERGAGPVMKWLIPILIVALFICWLIFRK